jgi:hypothetical protein
MSIWLACVEGAPVIFVTCIERAQTRLEWDIGIVRLTMHLKVIIVSK